MPTVANLEFYLEAAVAIILVFGVCITLHEFGHFYVAKRCGVAVPVFAIGFGPKIAKWKHGGTEYSIRLLPFGGFVQMAGEAPQESWFPNGRELAYELNDHLEIIRLGDPKDLPHAYVGVLHRADLTDKMEMSVETREGVRTFKVKPGARVMMSARSSFPLVEKHQQVLGKPLWQRASIILAGPVMNFLLAGVLFSIFTIYTGVATTIIGGVQANSPAQSAGLQAGDRIVRVNQTSIQSWAQLTQVIASVGSTDGKQPKPVALTVVRHGAPESLTITPKMEQGRPVIGIDAAVSHNPVRAIGHGFQMVYRDTGLTLAAYKNLLVQHQFQSLSGPVGIADVITQQARVGVWNVVFIAGVLSLNLGLFNLIPIPALDGGRLLFMVIELFRGRKIDPQKEGYVHFVGFALLMLVAVVITYRDVTHLF